MAVVLRDFVVPQPPRNRLRGRQPQMRPPLPCRVAPRERMPVKAPTVIGYCRRSKERNARTVNLDEVLGGTGAVDARGPRRDRTNGRSMGSGGQA
jgi:hypothetical protein